MVIDAPGGAAFRAKAGAACEIAIVAAEVANTPRREIGTIGSAILKFPCFLSTGLRPSPTDCKYADAISSSNRFAFFRRRIFARYAGNDRNTRPKKTLPEQPLRFAARFPKGRLACADRAQKAEFS
jgi:hypothetical protein